MALFRGKRHEEVGEFVRMLLLDGKNTFQHSPRGRVLVTQVADEVAIAVDRDSLGDEILPHHSGQ